MVCYVCLKSTDCCVYLDVFDVDGLEFNIAEILEKHFWFTFDDNDLCSSVICEVCWSQINNFHKFYKEVEKSHHRLNYVHNPANAIGSKMQQELTVFFKNEMNPLYEKILSEKNPLYDEPEIPESMVEAVEYDEGNNNLGVRNHNEDDVLNLKERQSSKEQKNVSKRNLKKTISNPGDEDCFEIVKKHILMACNICSFVGEDFATMRLHFKVKHVDQKPYIMCCGRKFTEYFRIKQHALKHENPDHFKCKHCLKVFANSGVLYSHILAIHPAEEELTFECDQCGKKFARRYRLESHKVSHIPENERKYNCNQCVLPKMFASEHLLKIHITNIHNTTTNVCHVCGKEMRNKKCYEKHVRSHFQDSVVQRLKCPRNDCDIWLKDEENLKIHLRSHKNDGSAVECNECRRKYKNRKSLWNHIRYSHSNKIFSCKDCQKTFKSAITLKEHMAQHTGEPLYKCPFCSRTFNSNANLHAHRKKMHPVEWDNWRKTKRGSSQHLIVNK